MDAESGNAVAFATGKVQIFNIINRQAKSFCLLFCSVFLLLSFSKWRNKGGQLIKSFYFEGFFTFYFLYMFRKLSVICFQVARRKEREAAAAQKGATVAMSKLSVMGPSVNIEDRYRFMIAASNMKREGAADSAWDD